MRGPRLRFMYHQMMPPTMMIPAMIHSHGTSAVVVGAVCASATVLTSSRRPFLRGFHETDFQRRVRALFQPSRRRRPDRPYRRFASVWWVWIIAGIIIVGGIIWWYRKRSRGPRV